MSELVDSNRAARSEILARVKAGLGARAGAGAVDRAPVPAPRPAAFADLKARFLASAEASSASITEVDSAAAVPGAVARYLAAQQLPPRAAVWGALAGLDWAGAGIAAEFRGANGADAVGITGVFCAIAETGTLVVTSGPDTAATTSLLPETHIAVVPLSRIVPGMEEALALVMSERGALPRAVNLISGPSRTGDIEQTIVLGAHGPSRVHLILVDDRSGGRVLGKERS
jgi:L-lactate dehydrogenase complex protein LldG